MSRPTWIFLAVLGGCAGQGAAPRATVPCPCAPAAAPAPTPAPAATPAPEPARPDVTFQAAAWDSLPGWRDDDVTAAWPAFLRSCRVLGKQPGWDPVCQAATAVASSDREAVRRFFEERFTPYRVINRDGTDHGMVTGYYEPILRGSLRRGGKYTVPLHRVPEDLVIVELGDRFPELKRERLRGRIVNGKLLPYPTRAEILATNHLKGKELVWVDDPMDAFLLQVQGSGRVVLPSGKILRLGYADANGQPFRGIGRWLVDQGELTLEAATIPGIRGWAEAHPERLDELLNVNPSYVFFKEIRTEKPDDGPYGSLAVSLTPERSVAIDTKYIPLGAPLFLATTYPQRTDPLRRLVMAQDTGGAIRGAIRVDYYWGTGPEPGDLAGRMRQQGQVWVMLPAGVSPPSPAAP